MDGCCVAGGECAASFSGGCERDWAEACVRALLRARAHPDILLFFARGMVGLHAVQCAGVRLCVDSCV